MRMLLNSTAFLSGCTPIAFINLLGNYDNPDVVVQGFAIVLMIVTVFSTIWFYCQMTRFFNSADTVAIVSGIKRKDVFASGAISYYVLPFISFLSTGRGSVWTLLILISLFLRIFHNNNMFLYTPIFDVLGYKILTCKATIFEKDSNINIITKDGSALFFTGDNKMKVAKIDEDIYVAILCE